MREPEWRDKQGQDSRAFFFMSSCIKQQHNHGIGESAGQGKTYGLAMSDIHFGNMILGTLREQRRSVACFAKEMGSDRSNMYKLLARPHLNSDFILRASRLLDHDFFGEASTLFKGSDASSVGNNG